MPHTKRIILAKLGLDGHDRGIRIVARVLRDAGMHVIYAGLWQTPHQVARAVADEDADAVGVSLLSGAHMTLIPQLRVSMKQQGVEDVPVVVGGIIPNADVPALLSAGVSAVLGPGASIEQIVSEFRTLSVPKATS